MAYRPKIGYYYHTSGWLTMNNNKPKKLRSLYSAKMFLKKMQSLFKQKTGIYCQQNYSTRNVSLLEEVVIAVS